MSLSRHAWAMADRGRFRINNIRLFGFPFFPKLTNGFSVGVLQGGYVALQYALTSRQAPAACIALSTCVEPNAMVCSPLLLLCADAPLPYTFTLCLSCKSTHHLSRARNFLLMLQ